MKIKIATNQAMLNQAFKIREIVFVNEQNVPIAEEIDQYETQATHFLVYDNNKPVATCRIRPYQPGTIKIERVCILPAYRKKNIGKQLMIFVQDEAKKQGFTKVLLESQVQAIPFYQKLGYQIISNVFLDANIEHQTMEKSLN